MTVLFHIHFPFHSRTIKANHKLYGMALTARSQKKSLKVCKHLQLDPLAFIICCVCIFEIEN